MPTQSSSTKWADSPWLRHFPRLAGLAVALLGLLIIVSWYAHWTVMIQILPALAPMKMNTALGLTLCGMAIFLLTTPSQKLAPWLGGAAGAIGLLTLLEYISGINLGMDELFTKDFIQMATTFPGRMSPLAASCFLLLGTGLFMTGVKRWRGRLTLAGLAASMVAVIAVVALFGYLCGFEVAYGWGAYTRMAVHTALAFFLLAAALLVWSWQRARAEQFNFLRWLPVTASVTLMIMIAFVSAVNMVELKKATFWRKHTFEVILEAQAFQDNLIDLQRGARGYVTLGDTNALAAYHTSLSLEPELFDQLVDLTMDNPTQFQHLKNLAAAMDKVFDYDERVIKLYVAEGFAAVSKMDATGESRRVFGDARNELKAFTQAEQKLLDARDASEESDYNNAERLLVLGSVLAALLLVVANKMASRELRQRQRVEARLRETTTLQDAIFGSVNYAIIALDPKGVVKTFNAAAEKMLGYAAEEVVGKATPMLWRDPAEVAAEAKELSHKLGRPVTPDIEVITSRAVQTQAEEYEATFIRKNGRRFPVLVSLSALADETGAVTGFLGVIADITDRKRAEEKIRESEERFRNALENAPIGMALVSPEGRWLKVNQALCAMLGYSETELLVTDFQHVTHAEDLNKDLELVRLVLAGTIPSYQMDKRYLHKNGSEVSVMLSVSLVRDLNQQPLYFVSQVENITERKQRETEREKLIGDLQKALAEVKTLSGMIPICGWCKSVRSDQGYWQTVEQYMRAHTDATFSHGMCPSCTDKFKADILKANAPKNN